MAKVQRLLKSFDQIIEKYRKVTIRTLKYIDLPLNVLIRSTYIKLGII